MFCLRPKALLQATYLPIIDLSANTGVIGGGHMQDFEPRQASAADLALVYGLTKQLTREKFWSSLTHWEGGLRALGSVRHTTFGVLHVKHKKEQVRRALVREAVLRLLEQRADGELSDELCLVTDGAIGDSEFLLSSAGIDWRIVEAATLAPPAKIIVGPKKTRKPSFLRGPRPPWKAAKPIRGVDGFGPSRKGVLGFGDGYVRVKLRLEGEAAIELPGIQSFIAKDKRYQNAILLVPLRVKGEVVIDLFCLNRDAKRSTRLAIYELGPLIEDKRLVDLSIRLNGLQIKTANHRSTVQDAVWELYENGKFSKKTESALKALPEKIEP